MSLSATKLTVKAPKNVDGAGTVLVRVVNKAGRMSAKAKAGRYTYWLPTITALSATSGPIAGGTTVTITGTRFTGATEVTFGGVDAASFSVVNATTITAVTPAFPNLLGVNTTVYALVTTPAGTTDATIDDAFTFTVPSTSSGAPTVTGVSPSEGPAAGGTAVTITGTGFTGAVAVDFADAAATNLVVVSDTADHLRGPRRSRYRRRDGDQCPGCQQRRAGRLVPVRQPVDRARPRPAT